MKSSLIFCQFLFFIICHESSYCQNKTVNIGNQVWMVENLNVDRFQNGDIIPEAKSKVEWERAGDEKRPAWCYYDNKASNGRKYGKIYNWYAVNDPRGLAPVGYKIPTSEDIIILVDFLGGLMIAGPKLKSKKSWDYDINNSNSSGFSGLPGGQRNEYGNFVNEGKESYWWNSNEFSETRSNIFFLISMLDTIPDGASSEKSIGHYVRCLKK